MNVLEIVESREQCSEAGWYAFDFHLSEPIEKKHIEVLCRLGASIYVPSLKQPFFKVETKTWMLKGLEGKREVRLAVLGETEQEGIALLKEQLQKLPTDLLPPTLS